MYLDVNVRKIIQTAVLSVVLASCSTSPDTPKKYDIYTQEYAEALERAMRAQIYIADLHDGDIESDINTLLEAIAAIDGFLAISDPQAYQNILFRYTRGVGLHQLAFARYKNNDKEINKMEMEQALADFDYVIASEFSDRFTDAAYFAGQVAYNFLSSEKRAANYWRHCAERNHAGCMNIVASGYFSGTFGFEVDIQKSIDFNTLVFDTGVKFVCAGSYSGIQLAMMAVFLPDYVYRDSWRDYLSQSLEMSKTVMRNYDFKDGCSNASANIMAFLLHFAMGSKESSYLETAISINKNEYLTAIARYFLGADGRDVFDKLPPEEEDQFRCEYYLLLALYEKLTGATDRAEIDEAKIYQADSLACYNDRAWLRELG